MHPSVEQAIGRDRIRDAFKRYENNPVDEHDRGIVRAVNSDGSYEVLLDGDVQTARCAPYAKAMVGDRVIVVTTKDGENVLLGRLGGEIETIMPTIEEMFEALEPVVLYNNSSGTTGTVTLSESAANFTYMEMFVTDNNGADRASFRVYSPNGKKVGVSLIESAATNSMLIRRTRYTISRTSLTPSNGSYVQFSNTDVVLGSATNYIKVLRVIGYR